ncbi:hypothetical protein BC835DRAFT_1380763 [Cytidiella melzeri]|nr:hypothetical protein BC835DRAFT_1380763 [Cytidiella melzeri]
MRTATVVRAWPTLRQCVRVACENPAGPRKDEHDMITLAPLQSGFGILSRIIKHDAFPGRAINLTRWKRRTHDCSGGVRRLIKRWKCVLTGEDNLHWLRGCGSAAHPTNTKWRKAVVFAVAPTSTLPLPTTQLPIRGSDPAVLTSNRLPFDSPLLFRRRPHWCKARPTRNLALAANTLSPNHLLLPQQGAARQTQHAAHLCNQLPFSPCCPTIHPHKTCLKTHWQSMRDPCRSTLSISGQSRYGWRRRGSRRIWYREQSDGRLKSRGRER